MLGRAIEYGMGWQAVKWTAEPWSRAAGVVAHTNKTRDVQNVWPTTASRGGALSMLDDGGGCLLLLAAAGGFVRLGALPWC